MSLRANLSPPLVLIHRPANRGTVFEGVGVPVHATARSDDGVSRVELWVDGTYVFGQDAPDGEAISPLVLHTNWIPKSIGTHEIIVRAYDAHDVESVSSIIVTANPTPEEFPEGIAAPEDEAASEKPSTGEEPAAETPSSGGDGGSDGGASPAPSDGGATPPPPRDEEPPESTNPASDFGIIELLFGGITLFNQGDDDSAPADDDGNLILTFEGRGLETDSAFMGLHCYVGFGNRSPRWYPDRDHDQSTDEYFGMSADRRWDVAVYLAYDNAINIAWPADEPVTATINCIGTSGDGNDSIDLGVAEIVAPPDEWDGIIRTVSASAEGGFSFDYQITQSPLVPKDENPSIPPPYNLRQIGNELQWDWEVPETAEYSGTVVGYLVYLNDVLVFEVGSVADRSVQLPASWLNPPCDISYAFTVSAYLYPYPDGDWSPPSEPLVVHDQGGPAGLECDSQFYVEFQTLRTGALPGGNEWGGIGPISGSFWANGQTTLFQGYDLNSRSSYSLHEMTMESAGMSNQVMVSATPGEEVTLNFDLGHYVGWDGFDDICIGDAVTYSYETLMDYPYHEGTVYSVDGGGHMCQVDYIIRPVEGTPLGTSGNTIPLPWLDIIDIRLQPETNYVQWDIINRGSAPWVNQTLRIQFIGRGGEAYSISHSELDFSLGVGEVATVTSAQEAESVWDYCYILDPLNEVMELYEATGARDHTSLQYCLPQPDLVLEEIHYNYEADIIMAHIRNDGEPANSIGSSAVDLAEVFVRLNLPHTTTQWTSYVGQFSGTVLEPGEDTWLEWPIDSEIRTEMMNGYIIMIDPEDGINELDEGNNRIFVHGGRTIRAVWNGGYFRWYHHNFDSNHCPDSSSSLFPHDYSVEVKVYTRSFYSDELVATWRYEGEIDTVYQQLSQPDEWAHEAYIAEFFVEGEEAITYEVIGSQNGVTMGIAHTSFYPEDNWTPLGWISETELCQVEGGGGGHQIEVEALFNDWGANCGNWQVYINRCLLGSPEP